MACETVRECVWAYLETRKNVRVFFNQTPNCKRINLFFKTLLPHCVALVCVEIADSLGFDTPFTNKQEMLVASV